MHHDIDRILNDLDNRRITRRQAVGHLAGLALLAGTGTAAAQNTTSSTFKATGVNHIALNVPDIEKSRDFYVKHLGLQVTRQSRNNCFMTCNDNFVALFRSSKPGMHHYCYSVENYNVKDAAAKLKAEGITPRVAGNRIYFPDPDGIEVQLAGEDHRP